jgi:hypothetical protein
MITFPSSMVPCWWRGQFACVTMSQNQSSSFFGLRSWCPRCDFVVIFFDMLLCGSSYCGSAAMAHGPPVDTHGALPDLVVVVAYRDRRGKRRLMQLLPGAPDRCMALAASVAIRILATGRDVVGQAVGRKTEDPLSRSADVLGPPALLCELQRTERDEE